MKQRGIGRSVPARYPCRTPGKKTKSGNPAVFIAGRDALTCHDSPFNDATFGLPKQGWLLGLERQLLGLLGFEGTQVAQVLVDEPEQDAVQLLKLQQEPVVAVGRLDVVQGGAGDVCGEFLLLGNLEQAVTFDA